MEILEKQSKAIENASNSGVDFSLHENEEKREIDELCEIKIQKIEKESEEFEKKANDEFQEICEKYNVSGEVKIKYESKLIAIFEKLSKISIISKAKIKQLIVGVVMLAATSEGVEAAGLKHGEDEHVGKVTIGMIENTERDADMRNRIIQTSEYVKNQLINHIESAEYLKKLTIEFDGDAELAINEKQQRILNLKSVDIVFSVEQKEIDRKLNGEGNRSGPAAGFYDPILHEINIYRFDVSVWGTLHHELLHASTRGNLNVSVGARKVLNETYQKNGFFGGIFKNNEDRYLSDPTEWLVRKQIFEKNLEGYGIKKYGDEFSRENYELLLKMKSDGKLDESDDRFMKIIKPGFENFQKIFENVAKNESNDDVKNV